MILRRAVALCATLAAIAPAGAHADIQRGFVLTSQDAGSYLRSDPQVVRMAADGNTHVAVFTQWFVDSPTGSRLAPGARTPTDASVEHAIATARRVGMQVAVKPQVGVASGGWVGSIHPADPGAFWAGYRTMLDHYADLAQRAGASILVVGTEMASLSSDEARWRALIAELRAHFSGALTYAANYDEFDRVRFWDALDYIGVDGYFALADPADPAPPAAGLAAAWTARGYLGRLAAVSARVRKAVLFTELGYRAVRNTAVHPNDWRAPGATDLAAQANAYVAFYQAVARQPWLAGVYWWEVPTSGSWTGDYNPLGKPAEAVMARANGLTAPAPVLFADAAERLAGR